MVVVLVVLGHIAPVFKLTKQEQQIVAFLIGAVLLGVAVKEWRGRRAKETPVTVTESVRP